MELAPLSALWGELDDQEWELPTASLDAGGAASGTSAAPSLSGVWEELCRGLGLAGVWGLVWAGSTPLCDRSLGTPARFSAAHRGGIAFLDGAARALVVMADVGGGG